jgi:hypothetical protein
MLTSAEVRRKWVLSVEDRGGDPPVASGGADADQGDRTGAGCSKNTVKKALAAERLPAYRRRPRS